MADVYGHRWTSSYGADPQTGAGNTWAQGLSGLTPRQVGDGLNACIAGAYAWPPTLGEFRALCLGVPPFAAVRADKTRATPFTVLVWSFLDGYRMRQSTAEQSDKLLREAYDLAREHVMRGGALPAPPAGLLEQEEPPAPKFLTPEENAARLAALRRELGEPEQEPVAEDRPPLADIDADLKRHYADRKSLAAGEGE